MSVFEAVFDRIVWVAGKLIVIAGAVILVLVVALALCVMWFKWSYRQYQAEEAARQAACHYVAEVIVEIEDHTLELPARLRASFKSESGKAIEREIPPDVVGYSDDITRFCLEGPQVVNLPITRFSLGYGGPFAKFAQEHHFPGRFFDVEFSREWPLSGRYGPPEIDPLTEKPAEMVIYRNFRVGPRRDGLSASVVTRGVSDKGYRSSARCTFWRKYEDSKKPAKWTCDYRIRDLKTGLNYSYNFSELFQEELDLEWVAQQSDLIVEKLRWLLAELSVDAPGNIAGPSTQQDL